MKIGILSLYHNNHNYGGQLQAYALCSYLNSMSGVSCEQISYDYKGAVRKRKGLKAYLFRAYEWLFQAGVMRGLISRRKRFEQFEEQIPHSAVYTKQSIDNCVEDYDLIFSGSDQVWNLSYTDSAYFLGFVEPQKRCSYAASFGKNRLEEYRTDEILSVLKEYAFLSVREENAREFLEGAGVADCHTVCDPTLLLSAEQWRRNSIKPDSVSGKQYLFVYLLGNDDIIRSKIKAFAQREKLEIVYIPHIHFSYRKRDKGFADTEIYVAGPWEFLGLIDGAVKIVTDSFHCCVFSLLFHKEFWAFDRGEKASKSTNSRLKSLLQMASLEERFVDDMEAIEVGNEIDYEKVDNCLKNHTEKSVGLLNQFLQQEHGLRNKEQREENI